MPAISISVPATSLIPPGLQADASTFPTLGYAVKAVAQVVQAQWVSYPLSETGSGSRCRGSAGLAVHRKPAIEANSLPHNLRRSLATRISSQFAAAPGRLRTSRKYMV